METGSLGTGGRTDEEDSLYRGRSRPKTGEDDEDDDPDTHRL